MAEIAVESLLQNLQMLQTHHINLIKGAESHIEKLERDLLLLKAFLNDSTKKQDANHEELLREIHDVVYDADDVIDVLVTQANLSKSKGFNDALETSELARIADFVESVGCKVKDIYDPEALENSEAEVEFVLQKLQGILTNDKLLIKSSESHVEKLEEDIDLIEALINDSTKKLREDKELKELLHEMHDLVYDAEDVIDAFMTQTEVNVHGITKVVDSVRDIYGRIDMASPSAGERDSSGESEVDVETYAATRVVKGLSKEISEHPVLFAPHSEEKDEKLDVHAALKKKFNDIYGDADEDTRRAMSTSFVSISLLPSNKAVTGFFAGEIATELREIATELLKLLFTISRKSLAGRASAEQLIEYIQELLPVIQEIKLTGNEHRQRLLGNFCQILTEGLELANKVIKAPRWNIYKTLQLTRKMERLEKNVSRFMKGPIQAHVLADVHQVKVDLGERFDRLEWRLGAMKIGTDGDGGLLGAAVNRAKEEEQWCEDNLLNLGGTGWELGKMKVKQMLMEKESSVVGIHGIGGIGKTTLARKICKDNEIKSYFNNKVFFLTVSQSPNVEQLRSKIWGMVSGNTILNNSDRFPQVKLSYDTESSSQALLVLDDVWTQSVLEQLLVKIPGCKILVVSRINFPPSVVDCSYELDLLTENEAMSLFCHFAFGQTSSPLSADEELVKQVVDECKRLPLALKVIGASLKGQSEMFWTSAKNRLSRGQPLCESHEFQLLERMKLSIDYLSEIERECFLDLGAFPEDKRIPLDILINMWEELHDIEEEEAFAILVQLSDKNLLTLVKDARAGDMYSSYYEISIYQHDVLRDLAVHLSNVNGINQRRRLLMPRRETGLPKEWERNMEVPFNARVISIHTGEMNEMDWSRMICPKTEVLVLNFSSSSSYFLPPFLENMPKLRVLILINYSTSNAVLHNTSVFSSLTNLRSLWFEKISLPLLPDTTTPLKNLKKVSLVLCEISKSVNHSSVSLRHLFPHLSELTMDHCINLTELPSSICQMHSLKSLSVTNCDSLQELPSELGNLSFLEILRLSACPNLKRLPLDVGSLVRLKYLDISQCVNMGCLPEGIGGCGSLEKIDMRECPMVRSLPVSVGVLSSLRRVLCNEEVSWLWEDLEKGRPGLCLQVVNMNNLFVNML